MLTKPQSAQHLLHAAGLRPKKSWGQNFLCDAHILQDIAAAAELSAGDNVVELGAGLGALTYYLLQGGQKVVAVERDRELVPHLRAYLGCYPGLTLVEADALSLDYTALAAGGPLTVVGNLPYQLASRILVTLANARAAVATAVVLVQREVAERLLCPLPGRACGLLTVLVQRTFTVEHVRHVPPSVFFPRPKVDSTVIRLRRRQDLADAQSDSLLVATARAVFSARRKTLQNTIAQACRVPTALAALSLRAAGIDPMWRAEALCMADLTRLAQALHRQGCLNHGKVTKVPRCDKVCHAT